MDYRPLGIFRFDIAHIHSRRHPFVAVPAEVPAQRSHGVARKVVHLVVEFRHAHPLQVKDTQCALLNAAVLAVVIEIEIHVFAPGRVGHGLEVENLQFVGSVHVERYFLSGGDIVDVPHL